jgi:hypothetical protein
MVLTKVLLLNPPWRTSVEEPPWRTFGSRPFIPP